MNKANGYLHSKLFFRYTKKAWTFLKGFSESHYKTTEFAHYIFLNSQLHLNHLKPVLSRRSYILKQTRNF